MSRPDAQAVPWAEILRLAGTSGLGAVLYAAARDLRGSMPADVWAALEQAYYLATALNARCLHELSQVGAALGKTGAPLLLLKGAALVPELYGRSGQRLIGDLDLAVPPEHVPACRSVLQGLGYQRGEVEHRAGSQLAYRNEERFDPPIPSSARIDLHWHLLDVPYYMRRLPMAWFWENSQPDSAAGQAFRALNVEANLVYLPAHLALHHRFQQLHPLLDLALLIAGGRERIDWSKVIAAARSFDLLSALAGALERLAACWPTLPIGEARQQVAALTPSRTDARLFRLLTADSRGTYLDFYTTLVTLPDLPARIRYAWQNLFPQPAYLRKRYGFRAGWQVPFWYAYRLAGGLARFATNLPNACRLDRRPG